MAKIESGTMAIEAGEVPFNDLRDYVERTFRPVADNKDLQFDIGLDPTLPSCIETDSKRLQQVLRNLLSNAFKFTDHGKVTLWMETATGGWSADHPVLSRAKSVIGFSITDTGPGIAADQLKVIFEPFQQGDMSTGRKYGGTGLGLSISREIARLLGGEIRVQSVPEEGSTFTLYLPQGLPSTIRSSTPIAAASRPPSVTSVPDGVLSSEPRVGGDVGSIVPGDRVVLVVEHDPAFAGILLTVAHEQKFKALVTSYGQAALELARENRPDAITLDLRLPDMDGMVLLDQLKRDPATKHIPVHVISVDEDVDRALQFGAFATLRKPVSKNNLEAAFGGIRSLVERRVKHLLIVEDNLIERENLVSVIGNSDIRTTAVGSVAEALEALKARKYDCLILDLRLPDKSGVELLDMIRQDKALAGLPVIVYTGKELAPEEEARIRLLAASIIAKDPRSIHRLLEDTRTFLHAVESLPSAETPSAGESSLVPLTGRKVLIVDDDLRNLFALTSLLERWGIDVTRAESGQEAIETLKSNPSIELVLLDIMMPKMDGYETMAAIRKMDECESLPIVALTAKAMKGDRQKCLDAGASDYIAKPVNHDQLLALLRVWLSQKKEVCS
jgi:CheY-like chemotaxis protein